MALRSASCNTLRNYEKENMKLVKKTLLFFVVFVFCFQIKVSAYSDKIYKELSTFTKVLEIVDKYYVVPVDEKEMMYGAIQGMLTSLDPHTVYMPPDLYKFFSSDTKGRFGGLGIEVSIRDGVLTVIAPLEGTPAWEAGLKAGDKILSISNQSTKNMSLGEAVRLMRGPIGKKVTLTVWREGKQNTHTVTLARELIKVPSIKSEDLGDGIGYFRIVQFQEGTSKSLKKEMLDFKSKHEGGLKAIMLDLRDNPGGLLNESVRVSDFFLNKGVIVSTKGRTKDVEVKKAHATGTYFGVPLVVLINGGSASASEIVAGALQDHNRAKLVGTKSFGKGSVQTVINLDNGGAVKITVAHYYTPKDRMIDGKGIVPDLVLDQKAYTKKNQTADSSEKGTKKITREEFNDFQKNEALVLLKRMIK